MPARDVDYHPLATRDVRRAIREYARSSRLTAARFANAVRDAAVEIGGNAEIHPVEQFSARWRKLRRFPYIVYFVILDDDWCRIVAVVHERRRPGFWVNRLMYL